MLLRPYCRLLFSIGLGVLAGCSTHATRLMPPRTAFYQNDLPRAQASLEKLSEKPKSDDSVVQLDLAMVELMRGDLPSAEARLRKVRDQWDHLEQSSLAEAATSLLTDDRRRAYAGEDYEKVLVRTLLTLTSLMHDQVDAESYSLQTLEKHGELLYAAQEKWGDDLVSTTYSLPAFAPYLRGVIREATHHDYDDASRAFRLAQQVAPEPSNLDADVLRAEQGVHSPPGFGVVYVIAFVGRGPYKVESNARATQKALLIADRILSAMGEYSLPPTLAPVKVPELVSPAKPFDLVGVQVDSVPVATTLPITDLHALAHASYVAKRNEVIARAVARRVIKKGAVYAAKDQFEADTNLASLALDAAGVLWEATEAADTRCWGLLPREIQVVRLELPAGTHKIALEPITAGRVVGQVAHSTVEVIDGSNSFVLSYWPDLQPIGRVMTSR